MPNESVVDSTVTITPSSIIGSRIGPIFDPKFLNLIPQEKLKDITIIQLNAQVKAMQEEVKAIEQIVTTLKGTKLL